MSAPSPRPPRPAGTRRSVPATTSLRATAARAALVAATLGGAALAAGCGANANGQDTAQRGAPSSAPITYDRSTPGADSGVVAVARRATPAVVSIEVEVAPPERQVARGRANPRQGLPPGHPGVPPGGMPGMPEGFPFGELVPRGPRIGSGSGFIVTSDGEILTNNHVVEDATKITVTLNDRRIFPAKVVGRDPSTDIALIRIEATGLPTLPLGDDEQVQVGQPVVAVGNPLGLNNTVTNGIISAKERGGQLANLFEGNQLAIADFLQTDAVINPGNSGGPLLDLNGRVIGINSAIESPTGVYAGYGFAVPITLVRSAMEQFRAEGRVRRAILGVSIQDVRPADAQAAGLKEIRGALVGSRSDDSPAARAGIQPGDVIVSLDGAPIASVARLQRLVYLRRPGQTVTLGLQRFGEARTVKLTLGEAPAERQVAAAPARATGSAPGAKLGIGVVPTTEATNAQLRVPQNLRGVAVAEVDPSGPSARLLGRGDVIVATLGAGGARTAITTSETLRDAVGKARNGVVSLLVASGPDGQTRVVNVPLPQ